MSKKNKIMLIYDDIQQVASLNLNTLTKLLNSLEEGFIFQLRSTEKICSSDACLTIQAAVLFIRDTDAIAETISNIRRKFDAEVGVQLIIITAHAGMTQMRTSRCLVENDVIMPCENGDDIDGWFPHLLMFLFGCNVSQEEITPFLLDYKSDQELLWYNRIVTTLRRYNKICVSPSAHLLSDQDDHINSIVILSHGDGEAMFEQHACFFEGAASGRYRDVLIFTDCQGSSAVEALKDISASKPTIYECGNDLALNYKMWTALLYKLGMIDCRDVTSSRCLQVASSCGDSVALKVVGIVLLVIIFGAVAVALFLFLGVCFIGYAFKCSNSVSQEP